jgi:long-chain acyl-CoA synthetase
MKLAQGEYVALESIENTYMTHPLLAQIFVYGSSLQSYLIAVVVPDLAQFARLCTRVTGSAVKEDEIERMRELCNDQRVVDALLKELSKEGKKTLKGYVGLFI